MHPTVIQAKDVIQSNKIILDVLEYPHLSLGPLPKVSFLTLAGRLGREKEGDDVQDDDEEKF